MAVGAALRLTTGVSAAAGAGGVGSGGGAGSWAAMMKGRLSDAGRGIAPVAISGTMTTAATISACAAIDSSIV
jgi:hypothetical protein